MRTSVLVTSVLLAVAYAALAEEVTNRWEKAIAAFEAADREKAPEPGGILFLGSSSIRMWDLDKWFPDMPVINRGFGGSQISDSLHFFDRVVVPYRPSTIVFYAGDNDIAAGESAESVAEDFRTLAGKVWEAFPETRILFIGIKPSTARWSLYPEMKKVNAAVAAMAAEEKRLEFIDVEAVMLGEDGKPRPELLLEDGLHMTPAGYEIWTGLVKRKL